jgi:hypothetical protein
MGAVDLFRACEEIQVEIFVLLKPVRNSTYKRKRGLSEAFFNCVIGMAMVIGYPCFGGNGFNLP